MAIALTSIVVKHERRLRLGFSVNLAAGGFATGPYVITSDTGSPPAVIQAYVVANSPMFVELALDNDISMFSSYSISALSVPGTDATFTGSTPNADNTMAFSIAGSPTPPNVENPDDDLAALIYGADLVFDGTDYVETDNGDLAIISGLPNYIDAINRRVVQTLPLDWDQTYGDQPGEYVNGPSPLASSLSAKAKRQAYADDRTKSATITFAPDANDPSRMLFQLNVVPIGAPLGSSPIPVSLASS